MGKAAAEGGSGPTKSPMTPEQKKEQEANQAEARKTEMEEAKKAADAAIEKNPVPKEEKKSTYATLKSREIGGNNLRYRQIN